MICLTISTFFQFHLLIVALLAQFQFTITTKYVKVDRQWRDPNQSLVRSYFYQNFPDEPKYDKQTYKKMEKIDSNEIPLDVTFERNTKRDVELKSHNYYQLPIVTSNDFNDKKTIVYSGNQQQRLYSYPLPPLPPPPVHPLTPTINVALLKDRFRLVSVSPLLTSAKARYSIPRVSSQGIAAALRQSPFASFSPNTGDTFITLNNKRIPLNLVVRGLVTSALGPTGGAPNPPPNTKLITTLNNAEEEDINTNEIDDSNRLWYKNTIDTIDHGYDDQFIQGANRATARVGVGLFSPNFARFANVPTMKVATLGSIGYQFSPLPQRHRQSRRAADQEKDNEIGDYSGENEEEE